MKRWLSIVLEKRSTIYNDIKKQPLHYRMEEMALKDGSNPEKIIEFEFENQDNIFPSLIREEFSTISNQKQAAQNF